MASATTQKTIPAQTTLNQSFTGCVKWFNNGLNYGFITVLSDGEYRNTDVFVHQLNIRTGRDCFRTLYTGECVQFELAKSDNEKHPFHAINVQGFNGVKLRCEAPRGTGFGRGNGQGRGFSRGRGASRGSRKTGAEQHQYESFEVATQEGKKPETSNSTNVAETTPETNVANVANVATIVESASAEVASARVSGGKGRGRGRGRGRKVSA